MRVLTVVLALVAMPFVASVSQESGDRDSGDKHGVRHSDARPGHEKCEKAEDADTHRSHDRDAQDQRADKDGDEKCADPTPLLPAPPAPAPPPPPPPPPPAPPSGSSITGMVYQDVSPWPGLPGWTVTLSGTVTATKVTDASGNYTFPGLPGGTYTICEVVSIGWHQTNPPASFPCYSFSLNAGNSAAFVNFGNLSP